MRVVILGAGGLIGREITRQIVAAPGTVSALTLADRVAVAASDGVHSVAGDICDDAFLAPLVAQADCIIHLAALLANETEADLSRGMAVNLGALMRLLDMARARTVPLRLVFTSSIAAFGGALPETVDDQVARTPQTSYGTHKAIAELLIDDYTRRGLLDGRVLRLPIVLVRNGPPSQAVSDRVAALIREPLLGRDVACGLEPGTRMPVASAFRVAAALLRLAELPADAFGHSRAMNLPSLSVTAAELAEAVARSSVRGKGRITWAPEAALQRVIASWPRRFVSARASALGLVADGTADEIVARFVRDNGIG